jgi:hypothetical protein
MPQMLTHGLRDNTAVGYAATALDGPRSVPDGFRELAEKEL